MPEKSLYYQPDLTLPDILIRAARGETELYVEYMSDEGVFTRQTYRELLEEARDVASGLSAMGLLKGDKVIITTRDNRQTIELLWGCFLLGAVPTVLQPPMTFSGYNPAVVKLHDVFAQLGQPFVFMDKEVSGTADLPADKVRRRDELQGNGNFPEPNLRPGDLAFIQFSSGSTGDPKGIMLTHENIMVNLDAIRIGLDLHYPDHVGNWMPLFHDMGLIGYHLTPMYCLAYQYQLGTVDFIMKPWLWLNMMSSRGITISGCTNFALALVLRSLKRGKPDPSWDFSPMKALLNGAEPISVNIMEDFVNALVPFGFRPDAMMPVYGMAEATLAISFTPLMKPSVVTAFDPELLDKQCRSVRVDRSGTKARLLPGVGIALNDVFIRVVDEKDDPLQEGCSGHIQIRGQNVTGGYYNKPEATKAAFCGEWLRTGDIGFFFEGVLYISGRHKDIIFKNGRNYFANDLENMASTIGEITYGKICFGAVSDIEKGQDKVLAFIAGVPEQKAAAVFSQLRALLRSNLGITLDEMVLVKSNEIPKTSSGKLQRYQLVQSYSRGAFAGRIIGASGTGQP